MIDNNQTPPATVPEQPESKLPLRKGTPVVIALIVIVALIGIANVSSLISGKKRAAPPSALSMRPSTASPQQVTSFETQQQLQAGRDAEQQRRQQELAAAMKQLEAAEAVPGPESPASPTMTAAQRAAIYGNSPEAAQRTSNVSEAQAEAKQKALAREKQAQDAQNSDTLAIDFGRESPASSLPNHAEVAEASTASAGSVAAPPSQVAPIGKTDPMGRYDFDSYDGRLYRVFEGTVFEGVVTNHIDGGFNGPILVMLTTDYYSHDHQQLLMPQGTRLIGTVQSVGSQQQRKIFVTFHRAVCPDGFSLDFDKYIGLDPLGTTGLATKVDHGYLMAFGAAAAIGGLGGLAQIGNNGSVLTPSTQIRNGVSEQSAAEGEQVLNHFLDRLPVITLKEGSRARIYVGRDILIPSYAEHRVDPNL